MRYPRNRKPFTGQLDIAPLAGVFFLLALFLLLQSSLVPPPGVRIRLPTSSSPALPATTNPWLVVAVDRDGRFYFEHQLARAEDLRQRLAAKVAGSREPVTLLVQADEAVVQAAVMRLAALATEAGIRDIQIQTRPPLVPVRRGAQD